MYKDVYFNGLIKGKLKNRWKTKKWVLRWDVSIMVTKHITWI